MKVELKDYQDFLKKEFPGNDTLIDKIISTADDHIICKECKKILPLNLFNKSKGFENRKGRYPYCKTCIPEMRKQGRR